MEKRPKDKKERSLEIKRKIRQILLNKWDPIGVKEIPEAQDEYDSYIGGIYRLIASHHSKEDIIEYLYKIEKENMGLFSKQSNLKVVAEELIKIDTKLR